MRRLLSLAAATILLLLFLVGGARVVLAQVTMTPLPSLTPAGRYMFATVPPPKTCGTLYVPCGPLPFRSLGFPTLDLPSSTPIPTIPSSTPRPITETPTPSATPTASITPGGPTLTPTWILPTLEIYDCPPGPCATELSQTETAFFATITSVTSWTPTATATWYGGVDVSGVNDLTNSIRSLAATLAVQVTAVVYIDNTPMGISAIAEKLALNINAPFSFIMGAREALQPFGMVGTIFNFIFYGMMFYLLVRLTLIFVPAFMGLFHLFLKVIDIVIPF